MSTTPINIVTITPQGAGNFPAYLREAFSCWQLALVLGWRDIVVRYKQTLLGFGWALLKPIFQLGVYAFIFGQIAGLSQSTPVPYLPYVFSGVLIWQLFSSCLAASSESLVANSNLVSKVYFPRVILSISATATHLADYCIAVFMLIPILIFFEVELSFKLLLLPLASVFVALLGIAFGMLVAPLNTKYRDVRSIVPIVLQVGAFVSPIGYTSNTLPENLRWIMNVNPATHLIEGFRWILFRNYPVPDILFLISVVLVGIVIGLIGILLIRRNEREVADVL